MKNKKELENIEKELEETAKELFKPKPKDIEEELQKETTLGSPNNLAEPTNTNES